MTVESVQGSQVGLEGTGNWGFSEMVARPLDFLSIVKWRPPPLEVRQERWESLPDKAGKQTLLW